MKKNIRNKNISEICLEINEIIIKNSNIINGEKIDLGKISFELKSSLSGNININQIKELCELTIKIAQTKNKVIRIIEKDIWNEIVNLPFRLIELSDIEINEKEEINVNCKYECEIKNILLIVLKLCLKILELEDDKSKASEYRRSKALEYIGVLLNYYHIPNVQNIFYKSIKSENRKEQFSALCGLEIYYEITDDKLSKKQISELDRIFKQTDDKEIASTCLQIKIHAGVINELSAIISMDNWGDD